MKIVTPYEQRAARWRELADQAKTPEERNLLLQIAESWNWIARDIEGTNPERAKANQRRAKKAPD